MPSSHMLPPTHKMYNMPNGCTVSPRTSGCTTLTCTVPLVLTFPISLPLHSTPCSLSGTTLNCRNFRMHPDPVGYLSNINSQHPIYARHVFPLIEEEHTQDSHTFITDLKDPPNYHSPASYDIHKTTPKNNPSAFHMEGRHIMQASITQDNLAAPLSQEGHT